jgi:glycosyltransferase involved in cell wall biosynthesis
MRLGVVFVDDNSPDGTAAAARAIGEGDSRVLCIRSALGISLSARC